TSQTVMLPAGEADGATLRCLFAQLYERTSAELRAEGLSSDEIVLLPALDMRYVGQSYELRVEIDLDGEMGEHVNAFHAWHQQRFSYANHEEPVEIVNLRVKAVGRTAKPRFTHRASGGLYPDAAQVGHKVVYFADWDAPHAARPIPTALYDRDRLEPGNVVVGPAVLFQLDTTMIVPPGWSATVDGWGNLLVEQQ
ncbi:MAG: hydantoinase/oxoprolinase family protein, partial [Anaerolineae bacterium]